MEGILLPACSVFFSVLLCAVYFFKKRLPLIENKVYSCMLIICVIDSIIVTILQCMASFINVMLYSDIVSILNKIDCVLMLLFANGILLYTMLISKLIKDEKSFKKYIIYFLIFDFFLSIIVMMLEVNIISKINSFSAGGSSITFTLIMSTLYVLSSIIIALCNIKKADKRYIPIFSIVILAGILLLLFTINPYLIIISISLTFFDYLMYFTIENPDLKMVAQLEVARDAADKANRAKSDFLSSMSHEIRTPLNAIVGLSEDNLTYIDKLPKEVVENSHDIVNASQTLLEIVGNILDINKIEANKLELIYNPYNFKEEVTNMCKVTQTRIGDKNIKFNLIIADDVPFELIGDKGKVKEIINNLLTNAIKYTDEGTINLHIKCINDLNNKVSSLYITCQDTGRGIKQENIEKLFTKFERLEAEKNSSIEGTGLGLAITKSLVDMMNGKINVQSQYGTGSIFMVTLPQKISKLTGEVVNEIKGETNASYGDRKILIVDDNSLNIKVAQRALKDFNFELDEAHDGLECLDKVKNNTYDLILMDIMMPNMSGEETFAKLKENTDFNIPVIALTADAVSGSKEKYIEEGFTDYIAKPFSKDQIKEKLDKIFLNK